MRDDLSPSAGRLAILGSSVTALAVARDAADIGMRPVIFDAAAGEAANTSRAEVRIFAGAHGTEILDALLGFARREAAWLVATSDAWLRFLHAHRLALDQAFTDVLHPANAVINICLHKDAFSRWCEDKGLPTPPAYRNGDSAASVKFPLMIRPVESSGALRGRVPKAVEAHDATMLAQWLSTYRDAGVQPFVTRSMIGRPLTQFSVGAARRGSALLDFVAVKRRPTPELCGVGTYVELVPDAKIAVLARRTLEALDFHGIGEVEILRDESTGEDYLIEVNCRPWVQYALGPASGHGLLAFLRDPAAFDASSAIAHGRRWLNFADDAYYCFSRTIGLVRGRKVSLGAYIRSILGANTFAYLCPRDMRPFWPALRRFALRQPAERR
jgi:predicted ATP-grasp superfamily ATP-dependent carboligase